jgi:hypothetical protein
MNRHRDREEIDRQTKRQRDSDTINYLLDWLTQCLRQRDRKTDKQRDREKHKQKEKSDTMNYVCQC